MNNYKQLFSFLIVGSLSAFVNFFIFVLMCYSLHFDYRISVSIAYVLAVLVHFVGNHYVTFRHEESQIFNRLKKYWMLLMINYFINIATVTVCISSWQLSPHLAMAIAILLTLTISFLISQKWVFRVV